MNLSTNLITNVEKANYIASQIGFYYYNKSIGNTEDEKINNTTVSIKNLGITDIEYENGIAIITLSHPGMLIGHKGSNINELTSYIKNIVEFDFTNIKIVEKKLTRFLYSFRACYDYCYDYDDDL
jgi:ribosomal protein S3